MTTLILETALLLLGAYFIGAFVGCLMRRTFFVEATEPVDFHAAAPAVQAAAPAVVAMPRRLPDHEPIRPKIESIPEAPARTHVSEPEADSAALAEAAERFKRSLTGQGDGYIYPQTTNEQPAPEPPPQPPAQQSLPSQSAAASAPAPVQRPPADPLPATAKAPEVVSAPPKPQAGSTGAASATSAAAASALAAAAAGGIRRPAEKAKTETAAAKSEPPVVAAATAPEAAAPGDDLTRIRAIDAALQTTLRAAGVKRFADIAAWGAEDVQRISEAFDFKGRIEHENWIEQAQILASGGQTAFAKRKLEARPQLARPGTDEGASRKPATGAAPPRSSASVSGIGAAVAASIAALPLRRPAALALGRDNLQRISQINEEVERLLNVQSVSRYDQIAHWTGDDVIRFDRLLGNEGRISRENWIEQAQILARGGETAYARAFDSKAATSAPEPRRPTQLAEAIRTASQPEPSPDKKVDLTALRSVRSEAFKAGDIPPPPASGVGPTPPVRPDDLKRIRGVGVLIEKRLNAMGVWRYEQIANWTSSDISRISQALEFRGRIERENWVEQARILASGGQTEFAKRVDRGEVETSRPKS